jgi:anti-sigma factor RsiW
MTEPRCEQLDEYLCGWLSPDEAARFEAHLADCPSCREERSLQRQLDRLLAEGTARMEPAPVALARRVDRKVRAARRRRLFAWAVAVTAAAGIVAAVSLLAARSSLLPRDDDRPIARRTANDGAVSEESAPPQRPPRLQSGGVQPESPATPEPPVMAARVTMVDPMSAIVVPVETRSPNVTLVCIYPTTKAAPDEDRPSP